MTRKEREPEELGMFRQPIVKIPPQTMTINRVTVATLDDSKDDSDGNGVPEFLRDNNTAKIKEKP